MKLSDLIFVFNRSLYTALSLWVIHFLLPVRFSIRCSVDNQELDNDLRKCKEEFKEFERQDVKFREDLKHKKQKIKKLEEKIEKVRKNIVIVHQEQDSM